MDDNTLLQLEGYVESEFTEMKKTVIPLLKYRTMTTI